MSAEINNESIESSEKHFNEKSTKREKIVEFENEKSENSHEEKYNKRKNPDDFNENGPGFAKRTHFECTQVNEFYGLIYL